MPDPCKIPINFIQYNYLLGQQLYLLVIMRYTIEKKIKLLYNRIFITLTNYKIDCSKVFF